MKKIVTFFLAIIFFTNAFAQKSTRPYYGGGYHSTSHGGNYPGSVNSHHKGGHYQNYSSNNRYGIHAIGRRRKR